MYESYSDRLKKVIALSNQEAQRFNHEYIGSEHLLLGILKEGSSDAADYLKSCGMTIKNTRDEICKLVKSGPDMVIMGKLPLTPRAKVILENAEDMAKKDGGKVTAQYLLLSILSGIVECIAKDVSNSFGADYMLAESFFQDRENTKRTHCGNDMTGLYLDAIESSMWGLFDVWKNYEPEKYTTFMDFVRSFFALKRVINKDNK